MDPNINELETKIFGDIRNRQFSKAIDLLTQNIIDCHQLSGDNLRRNAFNNRCIHYHLLRGYCNFKVGSVERLSQALDDIFDAIKLDANRFQPYLLGLHIVVTIVCDN